MEFNSRFSQANSAHRYAPAASAPPRSVGSTEQVVGKLYADQIGKLGVHHPVYEEHEQIVTRILTPTVTETVSFV